MVVIEMIDPNLKKLIKEASYIVVMTGAGMSVPSGIPDFRSAKGLYSDKENNKVSPEVILSHSYFQEHSKSFYEFYKSKMIYKSALPNVAHKTLAEMEKEGKVKAIITQNIDGLHQAAGSRNVIELHGSIHRNSCMKCARKFSLDDIINKEGVPYCSCGGIIKPDVVLYEEPLDGQAIERALDEIKKADLLLVVGTSLLVNPAASLLQFFQGHKMVIINLGETPYDIYASLLIREPLETVLTPELMK
jgi:NAD-dependent deacetylase